MVFGICKYCGSFHGSNEPGDTKNCRVLPVQQRHRQAAESYGNRGLYKSDPRRWAILYGYDASVAVAEAPDFLP